MPEVSPPRLLIVDDDKGIRFFLKETLEPENYDVLLAQNPEEAIALAETKDFDIAILDYKMPGMNGIELMQRLKKISANMIVIMITAYGSREVIQNAMANGAYDFFTKPIDINDLRFTVKRAVEKYILLSENINLKKSIVKESPYSEFIGSSPAVKGLFEKLGKIIDADVDVLITGESGTGKEKIAEIIHRYSRRSADTLVKVNCAAIPETLLESELFGHERGAFTGAERLKIGKFERANHGTIFLDEITEMSMTTQGKFLRVIQEREIERLGGSGPIKLDFRLIAATNKDIYNQVQEEKFREDLFYRLNIVPVNVPPLCERKEDIPLLAGHFLGLYSAKFGKNICEVSDSAMKKLLSYSFPGNVRQLENLIQNAVVMFDGPELPDDAFQLDEPKTKNVMAADGTFFAGESMEEVISRMEREMILQTLKSTNWKQQETADRLKISRKSLYNKVKKYGLME